VRAQLLVAVIIVAIDGGFLDRAVHPLDLAIEPPPVCRRLRSKYGWSLWKKVTEQTDFQLRCAHARFG
jgi:hypothetical protein